ncbi:A disintegrin and metalloproteinase with thrombospondin motifs 3 isoform X1 [Tachysurus ichikawai]
MIRTNTEEYFIEPLERGMQQQEENGRTHVVYKRSALLPTHSDISVDNKHPDGISVREPLIQRLVKRFMILLNRWKAQDWYATLLYVHYGVNACLVVGVAIAKRWRTIAPLLQASKNEK